MANLFNFKQIIEVPITDKKVVGTNGFWYCYHEDNIIITTHGSTAGELMTPRGAVVPAKDWCESVKEKMSRMISDKNVIVLACHEDSRTTILVPGFDLRPMESVGELIVDTSVDDDILFVHFNKEDSNV